MRPLHIALHVEGNADVYFLPPLITRAIQKIVTNSPEEIALEQPQVVSNLVPRYLRPAERIIGSAHLAFGADILIIHADADAPDQEEALTNRIYPGIELVQQAVPGERLCRQCIPLIPVRMIESWMLADAEALCAALRTNVKPKELGLPTHPKRVESIQNPKAMLNEVINRVRGRRHRIDPEDLFASMGQEIRLERLERVPSCRQFIEDLTGVLKDLGMI